MTRCMRPEKRIWGPSIDTPCVQLVIDVLSHLGELAEVSVSFLDQGTLTEIDSVRISVHPWPQFSAWLAEQDLGRICGGLLDEVTLSQGDEADVRWLLEQLRTHIEDWSAFTDPDAPDVLELVADY